MCIVVIGVVGVVAGVLVVLNSNVDFSVDFGVNFGVGGVDSGVAEKVLNNKKPNSHSANDDHLATKDTKQRTQPGRRLPDQTKKSAKPT